MTCVYKKYEVKRKMVKEHMTTTKNEVSAGGMNLRGRGRSLLGGMFPGGEDESRYLAVEGTPPTPHRVPSCNFCQSPHQN